MLELRNIVKDYVSGNNVTHALKGISVNFRTNEFVSILGPSGCGKTTTLNIIGGLDRYSDGDLLINGVSTKEYTDRDWDTYRNHSIGFVFQTYNLISHQNILKNVELALTIAGVSKEERERRAYEALRIVGLQGMEKKKPNQLSGGQCQRVAIARALVNNPEILLADEPTGALDTETSVQIMELLKEVAQNRLVIMVTHNPDLANAYSTRIIRMVDGLLTDDTNPFDGQERLEKIQEITENSQEKPEISKGKKKQSSMSIWTAIGLSTSNLLSKMKRTVLVTIAGSIGIIGVSAVLAASRGVKDYIKDLQNDMLSSYPITIAEESVDYTALISGLSNQDKQDKFQFNPKDPKVGVDSMIAYLMKAYGDMTNVKTNTIDDKLIKFVKNIQKDEGGVIRENYAIDPTNNIYGKWKDNSVSPAVDEYYSFNGLTQRYIQELMTVDGFTQYASYVDLFTSFMSELPDDKDYILDQYDVIAGKGYSTNENDLVLVVDKDTTLTDILLAQTGVFDHESFLKVAKCAMAEQKRKQEDDWETLSPEDKEKELEKIQNDPKYRYSRSFKYSDFIGRKFYYYPQNTIYSETQQPVGEPEYTFNFTTFHIDTSDQVDLFVSLSNQHLFGMNLVYGNIVHKESSGYVTETLAFIDPTKLDPTYKINDKTALSGNWFGCRPNDLYDVFKNTSGKTAAQISAELMDITKYSLTISSDALTANIIQLPKGDNPYRNWSSLTLDWADPIVETKQGYVCDATVDKSWTEKSVLAEKGGMEMTITSILRLKKDKNFGSLSRGLYYSKNFGKKFIQDSVSARVSVDIKEHMKSASTYESQYDGAFVQFKYYDHSDGVLPEDRIKEYYASTLNGDLSSSFSDLFSGLMGTDYKEVNATHLRSLCGYKAIYKYNNDDVFTGTDFELLPREIEIYPKSFEQKDKITARLDEWNEDKTLTIDGVKYKRAQRDELSYTDTISLIVAVIDTFINAITIALVVFTSLSLVVSCFMIAVITYISVVERIKEIGVIRSLGGRKRDVANLFVMETLMTGLFSGVFGIAITYTLVLIVNIVLKALFGIAIMHLTLGTAGIMILVSVALSVLSGLIPSQSAAHKDPVVALRSNE